MRKLMFVFSGLMTLSLLLTACDSTTTACNPGVVTIPFESGDMKISDWACASQNFDIKFDIHLNGVKMGYVGYTIDGDSVIVNTSGTKVKRQFAQGEAKYFSVRVVGKGQDGAPLKTVALYYFGNGRWAVSFTQSDFVLPTPIPNPQG